MENVDRVLYRFIGNNTVNRNRYNVYRIKINWKSITGKYTSLHCYPAEIRLKILYVDVDSAPWANELMMHKDILVNKINECLGIDHENKKKKDKIVKDIRFTVKGKIKRYKEIKEDREENLNLPKLSPQEVKEAHSMLPKIERKEIMEEACRINELRLRRKKYFQEKQIKRCRQCGNPIWRSENELCSFCERIEKDKERKKISSIIKKEPWVTFSDLQVKCKCDKMLFITVKDALKDYYYSRVEDGTATKQEEDMAVMLKKECPYEKIEEKQKEFILRSIRGKEYVRTFGRKLHNKK